MSNAFKGFVAVVTVVFFMTDVSALTDQESLDLARKDKEQAQAQVDTERNQVAVQSRDVERNQAAERKVTELPKESAFLLFTMT